MDYEELLKKELAEYEKNNSYQTRIAGDISRFRYPHMWELEDNFEFDNKIKSFMLKDNYERVLSKMAMSDITVYELLNPSAKRLHLYDFFGFKPTFEEKYRAFNSVRNDYLANKNNDSWSHPHNIRKVSIKDIKIRDEFEYLNTFINKSKKCDVYFYEFRKPQYMFQFGSTLKGTNVVIVDDNKANFYQELFHVIYHLEETIPGVNDDNMNILEIWSNPDALYLKQLMEGRMSRRIRNNKSPHDVKFLDYVFLRAYIGTAFANEDDKLCFHSAFALIEPTIKLLMCCIPGDIKNKNRVLIDSICFDKTDELKKSFNNVFGPGAYEKVFYDFKLFNRINTIKELCCENRIDYRMVEDIMFNDNSLVPTVISGDVVKYIWENEEVNQDKDYIINLIEDASKLAREDGNKITMENIKEYMGKVK